VWIPTKTLKYVAPELIVHYIEAHSYLPPQEFITAVMACPPQGSKAFFKLLSGFENWWDAPPGVGEQAVGKAADAGDSWTVGSIYEDFMGRWSRRLAAQFVSWLRIPAGVHWLDVGCGTGSLANAICSCANPASVAGADPAEPFIQFARNHSQDARISFVTAGVGDLPRRRGGYGSVTSLLALNFFPDPEVAVREMRSVGARNGTVSACVWDYSGGMQFLRHFWDAAAEVDPTARELDEGKRFHLCHPDRLKSVFRCGGLADVRCVPIEIPTIFTSFRDYWQPFLGGTGPAPAYVASLDADRRAILSRKLEETLPREPDGRIALSARAWAVRGTVS
jgi:SAM-dependent methyltransferase